MRSSPPTFRAQAVTLLAIFISFAIFLVANPSEGASPNPSGGIQFPPRTADTRIFDASIPDQNFSTNIINTAGDFNWTANPGSKCTIRWVPGYLELNGTSNPDGVCNAVFNLNLVDPGKIGINLTNAQVTVTWSYKISPTYFARWEVEKNGNNNWILIPGTEKTGVILPNWIVTVFNLSAAALTGTETSLKLRVYGSLKNGDSVQISNFRFGAFHAEIRDHAIDGQGINEKIDVTFLRFGEQSGLTTIVDYYQVYFAINDSLIDESDAVAIRGGSFVGDTGDLSFTINAGNFTSTGLILYYRLWILNSTGNGGYWSPTYSIKVNFSNQGVITIIVVSAIAGGLLVTIAIVGKKMGYRNMGRAIKEKLLKIKDKTRKLTRK